VRVLNTCTVTAKSDRTCRREIRLARRLDPECLVAVTGCYAQVDPEVVAAIPGVDLVLGNIEKLRLTDFLDKLLTDVAAPEGDSTSAATPDGDFVPAATPDGDFVPRPHRTASLPGDLIHRRLGWRGFRDPESSERDSSRAPRLITRRVTPGSRRTGRLMPGSGLPSLR